MKVMNMNIGVGFFNLWIFSIPGYGIIWALMVWANKKRGKLIEDPELYTFCGKKRTFLLGYLPFIAILIGSVLVPINTGVLFWIGLPIFISGIILNVIAMCSFAQFTGGLNTTGIYRYSRNPMYVGGILFLLGLNLMGYSISLINIMFMVLSILWIGCTYWNVLQEESFLLKKYGNVYREYMKRVPRYIGILKSR